MNGYNAVDVALDAVLATIDVDDDDNGLKGVRTAAHTRLACIPPYPPSSSQCQYFGRILNLWSSVQGILMEILQPPTDVSSLIKFVSRYDEKGDYVYKTIDLATDSGWAVMVNEDRNVLEEESERMYKYQETMFQVDSSGEVE